MKISKVKKLILVGALSIIVYFLLNLSVFKLMFSERKVPQSPQQTNSESVTEIQTLPNVAGQDPFKKFLEDKAENTNLANKSDNSQALPIQSGKDPFKEFLEKQKQNAKDQVASPFGKN